MDIVHAINAFEFKNQSLAFRLSYDHNKNDG